MSRRGNCYDNAVVERFFRTLKLDLGDRIVPTRIAVAHRVGTYIDRFYNTRRLHSTLGYRSPVQLNENGRLQHDSTNPSTKPDQDQSSWRVTSRNRRSR